VKIEKYQRSKFFLIKLFLKKKSLLRKQAFFGKASNFSLEKGFLDV